jgi:penicillin-binding protein 2
MSSKKDRSLIFLTLRKWLPALFLIFFSFTAVPAQNVRKATRPPVTKKIQRAGKAAPVKPQTKPRHTSQTAKTPQSSPSPAAKKQATTVAHPTADTQPAQRATYYWPLPEGELTILPHLQEEACRLLKGRQGSIVALNPNNGEVLCMASSSDTDTIINRAISKAYAPGSTFKTAQTLTLLSEGIITPETQETCHRGFWSRNIHIGCHGHRSPLNLRKALSQSCNSYFCKVFMKMVENRTNYQTKAEAINVWHEYMNSYGLGEPLGIDLKGEVGGMIPNNADLYRIHKGGWNAQTIMWMGMGQGEVKTTPLQLCNLAAMIANRGYYYTPHILKESGTEVKYSTPHISEATPDAFDEVVAGMRDAVLHGTCFSINTPLYSICGKTGTAENLSDDHSIFIGFAPMDNPQIAVAVYVEHGGFGADIAAPLAGKLIYYYMTGKVLHKSLPKPQRRHKANINSRRR